MKKFLPLILFFIIACNNADKQPDVTETNVETIEDVEVFAPADFSASFPELFTFIMEQDSSFTPGKFSDSQLQNLDSTGWQKMDDSTFAEYREFMVYNADSTKALDLVSYNFIITNKAGMQKLEFGGPDTEVGIIDLRNQMHRRILFLGSSGLVLDGKWDKNGNIILAGAQDAGDGMFQPVFWRYNPSQHSIETIPYAGVIKADLGSYYEVKYKPVIKTSRAA